MDRDNNKRRSDTQPHGDNNSGLADNVINRNTTESSIRRSLINRISKRAAPGEDPEDLLHDAYIKLHEKRAGAPVSNAHGYLVQTAVNLSIDKWRRQNILPSSGDPADAERVADPTPGPDEVFTHRVRLQRLRERLACLAPRTREIFLLHRVEGLKYREIAKRLGISDSAVEKHIAKALARLMDGNEDS